MRICETSAEDTGLATGKSKTILLAIAVLAVVAAVQFWIDSGGQITPLPAAPVRYSQLAAGFLHGQLSLLIQPDPQLLALPDPYDFAANAPYRLQDAVLFNGRYYLYQGPAPALLIAAACALAGIQTPDFSDQYPALAFTFGTVLFAAILLLQIRERLFPKFAAGLCIAAILSFGLAVPLLYDLGRPTIYETAIIAGQFFLTAGLLAAWTGLTSERRRAAWMTAAGICWALAAGSRVSLPPSVAAMAAITAVALCRIRPSPSSRAALPSIAGLIAPLLIGAALFGWYNFARFGAVTNFGLVYQLNNETRHPAGILPDTMSMANTLPNLLIYLLTPPTLLGRLPYILASGGHSPITRWLGKPRAYVTEPVIGLLWSQPFLLFGLVAAAGLGRKTDSEFLLRRWLFLTLLLGALFGFAPVLFMWLAAMRYLVDILPLATILAVLGGWELQHLLQGSPQRARQVRLIAALAIGGGCIMGFLVGVGSVADRNPALFRILRPIFPILGW